MPIVVDYESPGLETTLSLLIAQEQAKLANRQRQPQGGMTLNALADALNGKADPFGQRQRNGVDGGLGRGRGGGYGGGRYAHPYLPPLPRIDDGLERQYLAGEQNLALQQLENEGYLQSKMVEQAGLASRQYTKDLPDDIRQGLAAGHLRYNPVTNRKLEELKAQRAKLSVAPNWSPEQKMFGMATLDQQIRELQMQVEEVPINERPKTPQQSLEESIVTDPVTGARGLLGMRNGVAEFKPIEDPSAKLELEKSKNEAQRLLNDAQLTNYQFQIDKQQQDAAARNVDLVRTNQEYRRKSIDAYKKQLLERQQELDSVIATNNAVDAQVAALRAQQSAAGPKDMDQVATLADSIAAKEAEKLPTASLEARIKELHADVAREESEDAMWRAMEVTTPTVPAAMGAASLMPVPSGGQTLPQAPPQAAGGTATVWSNAEFQQALADPNIKTIVWGPTGKARDK